MAEFEWDDEKAAGNYRKHKIRFEEATDVFDDPLAQTRRNRIENGEQRLQIIGRTRAGTLMIVIHTVRENGTEVIRIISARPLQPKERKQYEHSQIQTR